MIGFDEALHLALNNVSPLPVESLSTRDALGRTAAKEVRAVVDSPSVDASIKDGFAVFSQRILIHATPSRPVETAL